MAKTATDGGVGCRARSAGLGLGAVAGLVALVLQAACGPSLVEVDGMDDAADDSAGESSGDAPAPGPGDSDEGMDDSGPAATSSDPGPDPEDDTGETSGTDDGADDDAYECGCEENIPIGVLDEVDGYSAAAVIESLQAPTTDWRWNAFGEAPNDTTLELSVQYAGGQVYSGPGGEDGCGFLSAPCPDSLIVPVLVTLSTADGVLAGTIEGTLEVDLDRWETSIEVRAFTTAEALGGTFAEVTNPVINQDNPQISLSAVWGLDGSWEDASLAANLANSGWDLIGQAL